MLVIAVMEWTRGVKNNNYILRSCHLTYAIHGKSCEMVQWLVDHNCPGQDNIHEISVMYGWFNMLERFAKADDYRLNDGDCLIAASMGNLKTLKWLRNHNATWDESVC
jgi:hypothetical protein